MLLLDLLLQQEHVKIILGIASLDGLYNHPLIDVRPELEATRMRRLVLLVALDVGISLGFFAEGLWAILLLN